MSKQHRRSRCDAAVAPLGVCSLGSETRRLATFECNDGREHSSVENRIQFDPIHLDRFELPIITSGDVCWIHSGQNGRIP